MLSGYRKFPALLLAGLLLGGLSVPYAQDDMPNSEEPLTEETDTSSNDSMPENETSNDSTGSNVEMTVGELEQLLNLPNAATLREIDIDPTNPPNLFTDQRISELFQENPKFVYLPKGQDPMIIPWLRIRVMAQEMWQDATIAVANKDYRAALEIMKRIRETTPNTEEAEKAPQEMARIEGLIRAENDPNAGQVVENPGRDLPPGLEPEEVELPEWIGKNTTGVLLSGTPVVIVGNDFLRVGDVVPRYAAVRVKSISNSEVVYVYQNKEFNIEVVGTF